ncbi:small ribosomal subunit protein mS35 [Anabrus simplex]|uniref:small ribosomal subunit protein mS35 n=1 Tax=Anabrus simplex TaxID=316456 RepID=UPI0034DD4CBD
MALIIKVFERNFPRRNHSELCLKLISCRTFSQAAEAEPKEEFRVLDLVSKGAKRIMSRRLKKAAANPPRTNLMPVDQDWSNVWPGPRSFHPASVPLPVRQGYNQKGPPPGKFANAELMKIPNFLHLTPPAIKKHCEALKKFCTPWPEGLEEHNYNDHFPLEVISTDYCYSSPSIRHPLARIVSLKVKLDSLKLDYHAKDKLLRLVGERYNPETGVITLTSDRCPLKQQNYDYTLYLLTALYHESQKVEPWESEKTLEDMEYYDWDKNPSRPNALRVLNWPKNIEEDTNVVVMTPTLQQFKEAVSELMNEGENDQTLGKYKEATMKLLGFSAKESVSDSSL